MTLPDAEIRGRDARSFSKFGFASVTIGVINVLIVGYLAWLFALWLLSHEEVAPDPTRMRVPDAVAAKIIVLGIMEVTGLLTGLVGLFEMGTRKTLPIIGIMLNGALVLLTVPKVSWTAWEGMARALIRLFGGY